MVIIILLAHAHTSRNRTGEKKCMKNKISLAFFHERGIFRSLDHEQIHFGGMLVENKAFFFILTTSYNSIEKARRRA
jgi:hypothetical protein